MTAPTNLVRVAECQAAVGKLVEAAETFRLAQRMPLPPTPPAALLRAQDQARAELAALEPRVPRLTLTIAPSDAPHLAIDLDGHPLNVAAAGEPIPLDPGTHRVLVRASGYRTFHRNILLDVAEVKQVGVALRPEAEGAGHEEGSDAPISAYASLGIGGVGLVVGAIFGLMAVSAKSSLSTACTNDVCPPSSQGDISSLRVNGWVSNVAFGVGIVGVGVGAVLLLTRKSGTSSDPAAPTSARIDVGPGGIGGRF